MSQLILFFDGECNLCNGAVGFVIRHNKAKNIMFGSLQSETGKEATSKVLQQFGRVPDSLIFLENGHYLIESDAALRLAKYLDWPWKALHGLKVFPGILRDIVYRYVARNRFALYGKRASCMVPSPELKSRFLG